MSDGGDAAPNADKPQRTPRGPSTWFHADQRSRPRQGEAAAALAAIPPDTRTLTGRLQGDPIPNDPRRRR
jgi:hypothetical protein